VARGYALFVSKNLLATSKRTLQIFKDDLVRLLEEKAAREAERSGLGVAIRLKAAAGQRARRSQGSGREPRRGPICGAMGV